MLVLLWICLLMLPLVIGSSILTIMYNKNQKCDITLSESAVLGIIAVIGISEVVHVAGFFMDFSLKKCSLLWGIGLLAVGSAAGLITLLFLKDKKKRISLLRTETSERTVIPFVFIGMLLVQLLFVYCVKPIVIPGDITLETVQSFLAEDGVYRVMPLTGQESAGGVPMRYGILCLPTMYAMLCHLFKADVQLLTCHVIPVIVLLTAYLSCYHLSGVLFGRSAVRKRYFFLLVVAVLFFFTDKGVFMNGYGALHGGYLGTTIRNLVLVPYALAVCLEKQWWKAVLCILAEACIVWTLWGLGVCVVIVAGIALFTVLCEKCQRVQKLLQIFRDEEDLA